jgi:hypothetical protein
MIAPIPLGRARGKGAAWASPARQRELEGPIRILCDASQPTYDQCALGGHHGVARARFGMAATRLGGPNHSDQICFNACRLLFCKRAPKGYCPVRQDCATVEASLDGVRFRLTT